MPHVIVKLWPGKTEEQKQGLTDRIVSAVMEELHYGSDSVSVSLEEIPPSEWAEKVYRGDIQKSGKTLYKKPGYTM